MKTNLLKERQIQQMNTAHYRRWLSCLLLVIFANAGHVVAKNYIVCIGVQNYPSRDSDTFLCVKDAKTMQWLFETNGDAETILITDKEATQTNIIIAMAQLFSKAESKDAIALFYSGHGDPGAICAYDGNLSYKDIWRMFDISKAKRRFAFVNACFSGTMRQNYDFSELKQKDIMFFMSSRSNEYSKEMAQMKNGLFTAYLQQGLRGSADTNRDKVITAKELFNYVSKMVAERSNDQQHPVMWGQFPDDIKIMSWK